MYGDQKLSYASLYFLQYLKVTNHFTATWRAPTSSQGYLAPEDSPLNKTENVPDLMELPSQCRDVQYSHEQIHGMLHGGILVKIMSQGNRNL